MPISSATTPARWKAASPRFHWATTVTSQRVIYDNKEWLLNAVSYLLDDEAQISLRSRTIAYRPLDEERILGAGIGWTLAAVGIPIAGVRPVWACCFPAATPTLDPPILNHDRMKRT